MSPFSKSYWQMCTTKRRINQERGKDEFKERNDFTPERNEENSQNDGKEKF